VRPEHKEIAATSITSPRKIAFAERSEKPTKSPFWEGRRHWGRTRQKHSMGLAGVRAQASQDGFAEITSGRTRGQQGLVATCKDSLNEVNNQRRGEPNGFGEWVAKSDDQGVMSLQETTHVSLMKVTPHQAKRPWALGGSYDRRGLGLIKPGIPNRSQGQERSHEQTLQRRGVCVPALELCPEGAGS